MHHGKLLARQNLVRMEEHALALAVYRVLADGITQSKLVIAEYRSWGENGGEP